MHRASVDNSQLTVYGLATNSGNIGASLPSFGLNGKPNQKSKSNCRAHVSSRPHGPTPHEIQNLVRSHDLIRIYRSRFAVFAVKTKLSAW